MNFYGTITTKIYSELDLHNSGKVEESFKRFNDKIKQEKSYDDYEWKIILEVIKDFVNQYPNNTMEIIKEEK